MKESVKFFLSLLGGFLLVLFLFFMIRSIDFIFLNAYNIPGDNMDAKAEAFINAFQGYRDFVTVITGLLTLIVGATGFGSYFSYKSIQKKKDEILEQLNNEIAEVVKRRKKLDMFLRIEEARNSCDPEWGYLSAIKLYDRAESEYNDYDNHESKDDERYLLYVLRGDAYYLAWKSCKSHEGRKGFFLQEAENNYKLALNENDRSMLALYGLGLVKFQLAIKDNEKTPKTVFDWQAINGFELCCDEGMQLDDRSVCTPIKLKPSLDYTGAKTEVVEEAIRLMDKAEFNGYDRTKVSFEMGAMYEALEESEFALRDYKDAYDGNYLAAGYQYCYLWMRDKEGTSDRPLNGLMKEDVVEIVEILLNVGSSEANYSKASYALLWYIYRTIPGFNNKDAVEAFARTDRFTLSNLFEMRKASS